MSQGEFEALQRDYDALEADYERLRSEKKGDDYAIEMLGEANDRLYKQVAELEEAIKNHLDACKVVNTDSELYKLVYGESK